MEMKITSGSPDANANGLEITSDSYSCNQPISVRVDDQPIETFAAADIENRRSGPCMEMSLDSDLAKRITASKRVVLELGGPGGPQVTFNTEGLTL